MGVIDSTFEKLNLGTLWIKKGGEESKASKCAEHISGTSGIRAKSQKGGKKHNVHGADRCDTKKCPYLLTSIGATQ